MSYRDGEKLRESSLFQNRAEEEEQWRDSGEAAMI